MDENLSEELAKMRKAMSEILLQNIIIGVRLEAHQAALQKVADLNGAGTLDGIPVLKWIARQVADALRHALLQCDDEQLAGKLQERLDHILKQGT